MTRLLLKLLFVLLKLLFGSMQPGQVRHKRFFHRYDMAKNRVVIAVAGPLDAHCLADAIKVLKGEAHARSYPQRKTPVCGKEDAA